MNPTTRTITAPGITLTLYQCDMCTQRTPLTYLHAPTGKRYCQSCTITVLRPRTQSNRKWR